MVNLGVVAFSNDGGLGNQTRRLVYMLKPNRILVIDARPFSNNKQHHTEWFDGFNGYVVSGFPSNHEINVFLKGLTHVIVCENPLNPHLFSEAQRRGIKVFCQSNYEFCDNLNNRHMPLPYKFLMPSHWHVDTMAERFGVDKVQYLPPPINPAEFKEARDANFEREGQQLRLLHIVGTLAAHDRNGTLDLIAALKHTVADFELVIRSQYELPADYQTDDKRVTYLTRNEPDPAQMYRGFDANIMPRRYGGLSLGTNESLMSGLPVLMPYISPNSKLLPAIWLYPAEKKGSFMTRTIIDIYESDPRYIAEKINWLAQMTSQELGKMKIEAFELGHNNFSESVLLPEYQKLWSL